MSQFLIHPQEIQGTSVTLKEKEAKHLIKVLRYKKGDSLWLTDGNVRYRAMIETITPKEAKLKLLEKVEPLLKTPPPVLAIALLKHDHLEWVLQKGVELGIGEFHLLVTERTIPHYHKAATPKKIERFEKIAEAAAKQSGGVGRPKVHLPLLFKDFTTQFKKFTGVVLAWEEEEEASFHSVFQACDPTRLLVLIGPEGGWTLSEVALAEKEGARRVGLGEPILRSETAAITLLTLCQYELGNI